MEMTRDIQRHLSAPEVFKNKFWRDPQHAMNITGISARHVPIFPEKSEIDQKIVVKLHHKNKGFTWN